MFFVIREIVGWALVALGLYLFKMTIDYVENRKVVEAGVIGFATMTIFRGGIHLVKASTAARVVMTSENSNSRR
jgi:hypothetical protein